MKNKGKYWKHGRRNLDPGREARPERAHLGVQMRSFQASSRIGPERCRKVTEHKRWSSWRLLGKGQEMNQMQRFPDLDSVGSVHSAR